MFIDFQTTVSCKLLFFTKCTTNCGGVFFFFFPVNTPVTFHFSVLTVCVSKLNSNVTNKSFFFFFFFNVSILLQKKKKKQPMWPVNRL